MFRMVSWPLRCSPRRPRTRCSRRRPPARTRRGFSPRSGREHARSGSRSCARCGRSGRIGIGNRPAIPGVRESRWPKPCGVASMRSSSARSRPRCARSKYARRSPCVASTIQVPRNSLVFFGWVAATRIGGREIEESAVGFASGYGYLHCVVDFEDDPFGAVLADWQGESGKTQAGEDRDRKGRDREDHARDRGRAGTRLERHRRRS